MSDNIYSYSKLTCFEKCQYNYYLTYVREDRVHSETIYTFLGSACHDILEKLQRKDINNEQAIEYFISKVEESDMIGFEWYSEKTKKDYIESIIHFFKNYNRYDNDTLIEQEFLIDIDGIKIKGFIDLVVFDNDNSISIYDYKTSTKFSSSKIKQYGRQLVLYAYAMEKNNNGLVINNIGWNMLKYALINGKRKLKPEIRCNIPYDEWNVPYIVNHEYNQDTKNELINFIKTTVQSIESKRDESDFLPCDIKKNYFECKMGCQNKDICKYFKNK